MPPAELGAEYEDVGFTTSDGLELDVEAALAFLATRPDVDAGRVGGLGLSVGGEMLLDTAAESDALAAVVSEGAGTRSIREHVHGSGAASWILLPKWSVITATTAVRSRP